MRREGPSAPVAAIGLRDELLERAIEAWRQRGYAEATIGGYRFWVARFRRDCAAVGSDEIDSLTKDHLTGFAGRYASKRGLTRSDVLGRAQTALRAWSAALSAVGVVVPPWTPPPPPSPFDEVVRYWREQGYRARVIRDYLVWMKRHHAHHGAVRPDLLTRRDSCRFLRWYFRRHGFAWSGFHAARAALRTWSKALAALGVNVPPWVPPRRPDVYSALLTEYRDFRRRLRGIAESSLDMECRAARAFLRLLRGRRRSLSSITIRDVDRFLLDMGARVSPSTLGGVCRSIRSFLRFLHARGYVGADLATGIQGPRFGRTENPPRGLPWSEVRALLGAIDRTTLIGKRDYAAFLLMASYGMGGDEVRRLRLEDIDWHAGTLQVVRGKTGVSTVLPLLGPVAKAVVSYLRASLPRPPSARYVFLRTDPPPAPLTRRQMCHRFRLYAKKAGITAGVSTHALRHSHATRQVESAAPPRVVGEILGHANPSSLSTYVRVAIEKLRTVCVPVPR